MQADGGAYSSSGENGSEDSYDRSHNNGDYVLPKQSLEQPTTEASGPEGNNVSTVNIHLGLPEGNRIMPVHPPSATSHMMMAEKAALSTPSLNIGTEYWNGPGATHAIPAELEMFKSQCVPGGLVPTIGSLAFSGPSSDGGSGELWVQDEREMKRQRRKQANRESARRSRMRKQAEFEDLSAKVESLTAENDTLKTEVNRLNDLCKKLSSENSSLLERIHKAQSGPQQSVKYGNNKESNQEKS